VRVGVTMEVGAARRVCRREIPPRMIFVRRDQLVKFHAENARLGGRDEESGREINRIGYFGSERWLTDGPLCGSAKERAGGGTVARDAKRYGWLLKLDVEKYFDSIPQEILLRQVTGRWRDPRVVRDGAINRSCPEGVMMWVLLGRPKNKGCSALRVHSLALGWGSEVFQRREGEW